MYRRFILTLASAMFTVGLMAQISQGGIPYSRSIAGFKSTSALPRVNLKQLDIEKLLEEDKLNTGPVRFGIYTDTLLDVKALGKMDIIPNQGKIWRLRISNENAKSLQLTFSRYILPEGATLFLYDDAFRRQAGAFSKRNMKKDSTLVVADFRGNHVILEYFEPNNPEYAGKLIVGSVAQAFKDIYFNTEVETGFININCPIGKDAQLLKHAVSKMTFRSGIYEGYCTGSLINNAREDGAPYFLTANHCLSSQSEASSLVTYFNYEVNGCNGDTTNPMTLTGSSLLSTGLGSDYTLLLLEDQPPLSYQPYFAGWNVQDTVFVGVTSVHNPYTHTKKISIDYDTIFANPVEIPWADDSESPLLSHWVVGFDEGKTSGGSSGGPLFNNKMQIIGQLHGGGSDLEFYGMLSYSYTHKPSQYPAISAYLDPDHTGIDELEGYIPNNIPPDAFFINESEFVCQDAQVLFQDYSVFEPYDRKWTITPASYSFAGGTSDISPNPLIEFHEDASYTIKLDLSVGGVVKSTETRSIHAGTEINVTVNMKAPDEICDCDFESLVLTASGADTYSWSISEEDQNKIVLSQVSGDTVMVERKPDFVPVSGYTIDIIVAGTSATCIDSLQVSREIYKPENDEIANAILLDYGRSAVYTNICATTEEGEPIPPHTSCTGQLSWCDECLNGEGILQNSVWFKFIPIETGKISIGSSGYDNEIALYDAETYLGILNNDYTLLAANDDRSTSDYRPLIKSQPVTAGKPYWIQVDGSYCGAVDDFYLNIDKVASTGSDESHLNKLSIYPQPATDLLFVKGDEIKSSPVSVLIYNISGNLVFNKIADVDNGEITLDIAFLEPGVYLLKVNTESDYYISRIVKY